MTPRVWWHRDGDAPADAVYVGRPSPWGNPYRIGRDGSRAAVVAKFRGLVMRNPVLRRRIRHHLHGRHLLCCDQRPCHAEVLLDFANR